MDAALVIGILRGTPVWVYVLAALLIRLGILALRPRITRFARAFITPTVFVAWGVSSVVMAASSARAVVWIMMAVAGLALAILTVRLHGLRADRGHGLVLVPGSVLPLVRNVVVFSPKYALAVAAALHPDARSQLGIWDAAVSGASAGYFIGWAIRFAAAYRDAPRAELTTEPRETADAAPTGARLAR